MVRLYYDTSFGIDDFESILLPISPSTKTYTYTFPLPDAPILRWRLDPVQEGGTLLIRQMRIINRRGVEIQRFTRDSFFPNKQIAAITELREGWGITTSPGAHDAFTMIDRVPVVVPVGMNGRNLHRCLLSTGYLALMLWILLLAVLFIFYRPIGWASFLARLGYMAFIALLFAAVGNRGLIRNSIHYARYVPPSIITEKSGKS